MNLTTFLRSSFGFEPTAALRELEALGGVPFPYVRLSRDLRDIGSLVRNGVLFRHVPIGIADGKYSVYLDLFALSRGEILISVEGRIGQMEFARSAVELAAFELHLAHLHTETGDEIDATAEELAEYTSAAIDGFTWQPVQGDPSKFGRSLWEQGFRSQRVFHRVAGVRTPLREYMSLLQEGRAQLSHCLSAAVFAGVSASDAGDDQLAAECFARALLCPHRTAWVEEVDALHRHARRRRVDHPDAFDDDANAELDATESADSRADALEKSGRYQDAYRVLENGGLLQRDIGPWIEQFARLAPHVAPNVPVQAIVRFRDERGA